MGGLQKKFTELIGWERRKRREQLLLCLLGWGSALAISLFPFHIYLGDSGLRWLMPLILAAGLAPCCFFRRRWRREDSTRAVAELDKRLGLEERALTAFELAAQSEPSTAERFVLKQAEEKLRAVEPRAVLPRRWSWPAYAAPAALGLWFALLWFGADRWFAGREPAAAAPTLAQRVREYAREMQDKARSEGLRETLKMAQELDQVAQKNLANKSSEEQVKKDVAGVAKKFEAMAQAAAGKDSFAGAASEESLKDLKAELEAARDMMELPAGAKAAQDLPSRWMERLSSLSQLKRQLEKEPGSGRGMSESELKSFLDRLNHQVTGELERRALLDAQKFLEQMMTQGQGQMARSEAGRAGKGEEELAAGGSREKNFSSFPGKEPGKTDAGYRSLPEFRSGAPAHVKGALGEGESSGILFKGRPLPGKSSVSPAEVFTSYRRQAEEELNSERVPEGLKETIKSYFLSLERSETNR
jgi:hypothetical protein